MRLHDARASWVLGRFRKHNATPNRDVTCLGMAWARLPVNREVASAWLSQRKELFSDVVRAAPCFWGPVTPFSLQYRLRQHVRLSPPQSMMTYHVAIWRRVVFSKSAYCRNPPNTVSAFRSHHVHSSPCHIPLNIFYSGSRHHTLCLNARKRPAVRYVSTPARLLEILYAVGICFLGRVFVAESLCLVWWYAGRIACAYRFCPRVLLHGDKLGTYQLDEGNGRHE